MQKSKEILTVLCCLLITINFAFAQGKGKGKGQGLLNNTGCKNGKGFTIGKGHLMGKSAVKCDVGEITIDDAIAAAIASVKSSDVKVTDAYETGTNTFSLVVSFKGGGCSVYDYSLYEDDDGDLNFERVLTRSCP